MSYEMSHKYVIAYKQLILELKALNLDEYKYATYRTACKLRFVQKKLNLHLIDLYNVIQTFRDHGLIGLDILTSDLDALKLEKIIKNMFSQLNMRLSLSQQVNIEQSTLVLTSWLLNIYDKTQLNKISVFAFKVALTTLCTGKLIDKFKFIYTRICDENTDFMIKSKFELYLKELLKLPASVFEEPSFYYDELTTSKSFFDFQTPINNDLFLDSLMEYPKKSCLIWLHVFNRMILTQNVVHNLKCAICTKSNFMGFRYKCLTCRNYQMCQDCFWKGKLSSSHLLTHEVKEYTHYKSQAKKLTSSLKRSFFCKPSKHNMLKSTNINNTNNANYEQQLECSITPTKLVTNKNIPLSTNTNPRKSSLKLSPCCSVKSVSKEQNVLFNKPINLAHIVPSPTITNSMHNQQQQPPPNELPHSPNKSPLMTPYHNDMNEDEHRLISRYTTRLANYYASQTPSQSHQTIPLSISTNDNKYQEKPYKNLNNTTNSNNTIRSISETNFKSSDSTSSTNILEKKRHLMKLEQQNRELSNELKRLIMQQNEMTNSQYNSQFNSNNQDADSIILNRLSRESTPFTLSSYNTNMSNMQTSKSILAAVNLLNNNSMTTSQLLQGHLYDPYVLAELKSLKQYQDDLDNRMNHLEHNRYELINQLTQLKRTTSLSTRSTPIRAMRDQTPLKYATMTNSYQIQQQRHHPQQPQQLQQPKYSYQQQQQQQHYPTLSPSATLNYNTMNNNQYFNPNFRSSSMPSTPSLPKLHPQPQSKHQSPMRRLYPNNLSYASSTLSSSNYSEATTTSTHSFVANKTLRDDLLNAADSLTNAMHDLVKELEVENINEVIPLNEFRNAPQQTDNETTTTQSEVDDDDDDDDEDKSKREQQEPSQISDIGNVEDIEDDEDDDMSNLSFPNPVQAPPPSLPLSQTTTTTLPERKKTLKQLDLDEEAFIFTSQAYNDTNDDVTSWRKELEQRLNTTSTNNQPLAPTRPITPTPPSSTNDEISNKSSLTIE